MRSWGKNRIYSESRGPQLSSGAKILIGGRLGAELWPLEHVFGRQNTIPGWPKMGEMVKISQNQSKSAKIVSRRSLKLLVLSWTRDYVTM